MSIAFGALTLREPQLTEAQQVGERISQERREKAARDRRDIQQKDLAKAVDASTTAVSRWESGEQLPSPGALERLAAYFGVSRSWLRYGEGGKAPETPKLGFGKAADEKPGKGRKKA